MKKLFFTRKKFLNRHKYDKGADDPHENQEKGTLEAQILVIGPSLIPYVERAN